jgi:hypothetical protein
MRFHVIPISELDFAVFMSKLYEERKKVDVAAALRYEPIYVHRGQRNGLDEVQKRFQSDEDRILFLTPSNLSLLRGESLKLEPIAEVAEAALPSLNQALREIAECERAKKGSDKCGFGDCRRAIVRGSGITPGRTLARAIRSRPLSFLTIRCELCRAMTGASTTTFLSPLTGRSISD